jgi:small subunit ribosomal protein S20
MPNLKASIRDVKKSKKRKSENTARKNAMKKAIRALSDAFDVGGDEKKNVPELLSKAYKAIDKASKSNVIHRNNAARKKSKLAKMIAK